MSIKLSFLGAAHTVTGSSFLLETESARVLIDCGMFQGSKTLKELNYGPFPFSVADLDAVLLTHAHIDHSGLLPKLSKAGFPGPIYASHASVDLLGCMLPDSGHIQEMEVEQLNRRNQHRHRPVVAPIYTMRDAEACLDLLHGVGYQSWQTVAAGIRARFWNAGHMLGSASIEIECHSDQPKPLRLLFSGDIGPTHKLLQAAPQAVAGFDYILCEATYGDRIRGPVTDEHRRAELCSIVRRAQERGGPLIIPSFAVERTQELLTDLGMLVGAKQLPNVPTFIDSPLAQRATDVFRAHSGELEHAEDLLAALRSPWLRFSASVEDSKMISRLSGFHIVIAASGMCEAGRIRHHLKQWLWRSDATVLLVGFQAQGTLGRLLQDGAATVRIQGEEIKVAARIEMMDDYSGHADANELIDWLRAREPIAKGVFLVHGEAEAIEAMARRIADMPGLAKVVVAPQLDETFVLDGAEPSRIARAEGSHVAADAPIRLDSHNETSEFLIALNDRLERAADERSRRVILRRLRRALDET